MSNVIWDPNLISRKNPSFPYVINISNDYIRMKGLQVGQHVNDLAEEWLESIQGSIAVQAAINNFCVGFETEEDAILFKLSLDT